MSQTLSLHRLQQIDSQIDRVQTRLLAIDKILADDVELAQARDLAKAAAERFHTDGQTLKQIELDVQNQRIKIDQIESSLYQGASHSPKELQDLQKDAAAIKRYLAGLEDRQLEAMLAVEKSEADRQTADAHLQACQGRQTDQNKKLHEEQASLKTEADRLLTEREAASGGIPAGDLSLYDRLRQQRRGVAVADIQDNSCSACGSFLSAAQVQAARNASQIGLCPSCGRILYGA
jgi:uncharacterized protein